MNRQPYSHAAPHIVIGKVMEKNVTYQLLCLKCGAESEFSASDRRQFFQEHKGCRHATVEDKRDS